MSKINIILLLVVGAAIVGIAISCWVVIKPQVFEKPEEVFSPSPSPSPSPTSSPTLSPSPVSSPSPSPTIVAVCYEQPDSSQPSGCSGNNYCCGGQCVIKPASCPTCQYQGLCCSGTAAVCCNESTTKVCGEKDCDYLDTTCKDYHDVTKYCNGNGSCSDPDCNSYTNVSTTSLECWIPSDRAAKYYISSGSKEFPIFEKELIADPFKVKEGEKQIFSIWVKDPKGIEKVIGTITTDKEEVQLNFILAEGTKEEGRWLGSWITKDISKKDVYTIVFKASNVEGKEIKVTFFWQVEK